MASLEISLPELAEVLLKCLAVLLLLWICLPHAIAALGRRARQWVEGGPADLVPDGSDPVYADFYAQLAALGFEPLGFHREAMDFGPRFRTAIFRCRRFNSFAGLYRLSRYDDPRVQFVSVFEDAAVIVTKNDETLAEQDGDYLRQGVYSRRVEDVLRLHLEAVQRYCAAGRRECAGGILERKQQLSELFYRNRRVRAQLRRNFGEVLKAQLVLVGSVTALAWLKFGAESLVPWLVLALACLGWKALMEYGLHKLAYRADRPEPAKPSQQCLLCAWPARLQRLLVRWTKARQCAAGPPPEHTEPRGRT